MARQKSRRPAPRSKETGLNDRSSLPAGFAQGSSTVDRALKEPPLVETEPLTLRSEFTGMLDGPQPPDHWLPLLQAATERGVVLKIALDGDQGRPLLDTPGRRTILILGDDYAGAQGPDAFDAQSLDREIKAAHVAHLLLTKSSVVRSIAYSSTVRRAAFGNVLLVETAPERKHAWISRIQTANPDIAPDIWAVSSPTEGGRP